MLAWVMNLGFAASPANVPPPPPVILPPPPTGSAPGKLGRKKKRKDGPYMREGQVFGEEYPFSPSLNSVAKPSESRKSRRGLVEAMLKELL